MPRSLKKGPFVDAHLFAKVEAAIAANNRKPIKTLVASFDDPPGFCWFNNFCT